MKQMVYFFVVFLTLAFIGTVTAGDYSFQPAEANTYFDIATGHKYIKNSDDTYSEYSKCGKLIRSNVSNTMPLLVSGKYVHEVTPDHLLVYEKRMNSGMIHKVLPASSNHPQGWQCKQMVSQVHTSQIETAEAYEPAE